MEERKQIRFDADGPNAQGTDIITTAIRQLLNQFPGLNYGESISFSTLSPEEGISIFPISGAVIEKETADITDHVTQICLYPFYVVYRSGSLNQNRKANVKEWLDNLGRWLERQPVSIDEMEYKLLKYPRLTGKRKFLSISRQTPAYLDSVTDGKVEDWAIYISARYQYEFNK